MKHQQPDSALAKQVVHRHFFSFPTLADLIEAVFESHQIPFKPWTDAL